MEHVLQNDCLRLTVDPQAGAKITSLRDLRTGREWLWRNPHLPETVREYGGSYVDRWDTGGWDEIFPSVAPCQIGFRIIPDHGDLVSLPWTILSSTGHQVEMEITSRFAPCRFVRTLGLDGESVIVQYEVENRGGESVPYLWCAHPLFAIEEGMEISLPTGTEMSMIQASGLPLRDRFVWPNCSAPFPLDLIPGPDASPPFALKLFTAKGQVDQVILKSPNRLEALDIRWDGDFAPYLGLWLNYGAWGRSGSPPYFNLGLEPATAPFDSLADALRAREVRWLDPGAIHRWSMAISSGVTAGGGSSGKQSTLAN